MKNKMDDLRNHLFETLEALKDEDKPMDLDRARAVAEVANVLVETAKTEVQFIKATGRIDGSRFLDNKQAQTPAINGERPNGIGHS